MYSGMSSRGPTAKIEATLRVIVPLFSAFRAYSEPTDGDSGESGRAVSRTSSRDLYEGRTGIPGKRRLLFVRPRSVNPVVDIA
jgi:hypothetical protein